jgi:nitrite reductase (NO-forming)
MKPKDFNGSLPSTARLFGLLVLAAWAAWPARVEAKVVKVEMTAIETEVVIDNNGTKYKAWTYDGQFPGPVVRVTEGDTIEFSLTNPKSNTYPHSMDFHAGEMDFLKNHKQVERGATQHITFTPKKPGIFFYHCGVQPMIQHVARGMMGAIIVDPKNHRALPKADREYVLVQSELFKNPDDVQGMFDRKSDHTVFNGGVFRYHPFLEGKPLEAKPGERVRIYFVNAGPNNFSAFHPIGEIWDNAWASGNPANKVTGVQTVVVGPGDAAIVDVVVEEEGGYPMVTHSLTDALRGAIAVLLVKKDAQTLPLMPYVDGASSKAKR